MITLSDFQVLSFDKKCDFITVFADYLIYRVEDDKKYFLYYLDHFFIEVCYSPDENKVVGINAFMQANDLDAYLQEIEISDLYIL